MSWWLHTYDRNNDIVHDFYEAWCATTNTLHTSSRELSISLWHLWRLWGFSIKGRFYNEVIPSCKELLARSADCPRSFEHLFSVYYSIGSHNVILQEFPLAHGFLFGLEEMIWSIQSLLRESRRVTKVHPSASLSTASSFLLQAFFWELLQEAK